MEMIMRWVLSLPLLFVLFGVAGSCGVSTHIEISHRAQDSFYSSNAQANFGELLLKHQDALEGGAPYPDSYYDPICFGGKYHNISEDTHWTPFMNATINYIRQHYPPPWDQATEKLVVFLLGVVSHQTADVSWHGLGIEQGFLDAMAAINFHGSFGTAHPIGDVGGDIMTMFEFNVSYIPYLTEWYIPVDDLYNIYTELYGVALMPKDVIVACTLEMYAERLGEKLAIGKLYPDYAKKSPYLVDQLSDYFLGGVDDMAVWTQRIWRHAITMLQNGTRACKLDHNPLFVTCGEGREWGGAPRKRRGGRGGKPEVNGFYKPRQFMEVVGMADIKVEKALRGVRLAPGPRIQDLLRLKDKQRAMADVEKKKKKKAGEKEGQSQQKYPEAVWFVSNTYARLGQSMAVGDVDGDGNDDVIIGAPGFRRNESPQDGAIFVIFGSDKGLPPSSVNLAQSADVILYGKKHVSGRLGWSVAIVDVNMDGVMDIAAGAPSTGSAQLSYTGEVQVFYGRGQRRFDHNMTVTCQDHYCNLGGSVAAADVDGDGHDDLLIASPFSGAKGDQRGVVTAVVASKQYQGRSVELSTASLPWKLYGSQNYSWFGQSMTVVPAHPVTSKNPYILLSEPAWRSCALPNCSFTEKDRQAEGRLNLFAPQGERGRGGGRRGRLSAVIRGTQPLQYMGSGAAVGSPLTDRSTLVLAVSAPGQDVAGTVADVDVTFPQTGAVRLYNLSDLHLRPSDLDISDLELSPPLAVFSGDRRYSRFGAQIKFADVNGDGYDDLMVGAPLRTDDITEEIYAGEEGAAYVYYGGPAFPLGSKATSQCPPLSLVTPCPAAVASVELMFGEDKARLGSQFAVVKSKSKVQLLVTAAHSSRGARLSGAVAVYTFP